MIRTSACLAALLILLTGCGSKQPAVSKSVPAKQPVYNAPPLQSQSPASMPGPTLPSQPGASALLPATSFPQPATPAVIQPSGNVSGQPPAALQNSAFLLAEYQILETIEFGPGKSFEPEGGEKIVWVCLEVKGMGSTPLVVNLAGIKLTADGTSYNLSGVSFGRADPYIQHLIDPAITQSGTVTTSRSDFGETVYDVGNQQATFQKLPSRMSLMFLVTSAPATMQIEGLPDAVVKVK